MDITLEHFVPVNEGYNLAAKLGPIIEKIAEKLRDVFRTLKTKFFSFLGKLKKDCDKSESKVKSSESNPTENDSNAWTEIRKDYVKYATTCMPYEFKNYFMKNCGEIRLECFPLITEDFESYSEFLAQSINGLCNTIRYIENASDINIDELFKQATRSLKGSAVITFDDITSPDFRRIVEEKTKLEYRSLLEWISCSEYVKDVAVAVIDGVIERKSEWGMNPATLKFIEDGKNIGWMFDRADRDLEKVVKNLRRQFTINFPKNDEENAINITLCKISDMCNNLSFYATKLCTATCATMTNLGDFLRSGSVNKIAEIAKRFCEENKDKLISLASGVSNESYMLETSHIYVEHMKRLKGAIK